MGTPKFINSLKIGAVIKKGPSPTEKDTGGTICSKMESKRSLDFLDRDTHKKFVDFLFDSVKK